MASHGKYRMLLGLAMVGGLSAGALIWSASDGQAQTMGDPELGPTDRGTLDRRSLESGPSTSTTPRTDEAVAERERRLERERTHQRYAARDHRHRGEVYIGGFGGGTLAGTTSGMVGRGSQLGDPVASPDLADSIVYGLKVGYFHPGRLNWLGLELEAFNSTPHLKQSGLQAGSHMRLTTVGLNAIARTKLGCRDDRPRDGVRDRRDDDAYGSPLADNARCPLHLYAGAGLGVFFAETSNQFGRSSENARAGLNALAGAKYFLNEHFSLFAEYKFNYVDLKFDQNQPLDGPTAGLNGTYMINHVVGGLAVHF